MITQVAGPALYHLRPSPLIGTHLVPLAQLRDLDASAYALHARKYEDRPGMLERWVEPLDCRWSDCIFLSPIDPRALTTRTRQGERARRHEWLIIDAARLDPARAVLMTPTRWTAGPDGPPAVTRQQCAPFTLAAVAAAATPSDETVARMQDNRNRLPMWTDVVHVLYRGSIDVRQAPTLVT
jgi:hypothetical protein